VCDALANLIQANSYSFIFYKFYFPLVKRIITALVLLPIVCGMLFFVPTFPYLEIFIALFVGVCAWEWAGFCYNLVLWRLSYCFIVVGLYFLMLAPLLGQILIIASGVMWLFALFRVLNYNQNPQSTLRLLLTGSFLISACSISIFALKSISDYALLLVLLWVWVADTLGLAVGKKFGKNKLIPLVSPRKTWEGLYGGLAGSVVVSGFAYYFMQLSLMKLIGIGLLVTLCSVLGDLLVSCYKRQAGLEDTGSILPGHGGVLDRVDGLLAAGPLGWLLISFSGVFS
jgi:phosphatidate cytidylyltransferase